MGILLRRRVGLNRKKILFTKAFTTVGTQTWTVPEGCTSVDVFLVGGGGGGVSNGGNGGGGGFTKTFKGSGYIFPGFGTWEGSYFSGRDGNAIPVTPGENITIYVGTGGNTETSGAYSYFKNTSYLANGGNPPSMSGGGSGGSGGGIGNNSNGGSDGSYNTTNSAAGQGHTTREFGEPTGKRHAAGGGGSRDGAGGISDNTAGSGSAGSASSANRSGGGGGGYGGGGGAAYGNNPIGGKGGQGIVLIRYWAYHE